MESNKKMSIGRIGILFFLALFFCLMLQRDDVRAVTIPEGSYTPTGSAITYTFTGASDDLNNGYVANVERYTSAAIKNGELRIPDTILYKRDGEEREVNVRVAGILRGVFNGSTSLTKLVLPDTITYIGQEAFANCTNLSSIQTVSTDGQTSPSTGYLAVDEIEYHAFYGCSSLTGITLGEKVK